jgi:threonylcarbamoyladenosine tRNA methylthiotransferase MtaB
MKKFKIITLGCKVNQAESEAMGAALTSPDWHPVETSEAADLCIINTCAVTQKAAMQSRQAVRQAIQANPQARVVVTGCYAQTEPQALAKIDGLDYILDQAGKQRLAEMVRGGELTKCARPVMFQPAPGAACAFAAAQPVPSAHRTRPFLKIQDGCDAFCTYCIVPYARGRSRSMAFAAVLESISELVAQGVHEAVLTGIHLGHYGRDLKPPCGLLQLLQAIAASESSIRVRLSSIEPLEVTDELLRLVARSDRICRHFHIPLQSGDHAILKRMGRPYSPEFFAGRVKKIRAMMPDAAIGADVLVGFPGETEAAFANTYSLIESLPVSYLHVFPFSARPGTAAARFPDRVPPQVIKERCRRLRQLGQQLRTGFYRSFIGRRVAVLAEGRRDPVTGLLKGVSDNYLPVLFTGEDRLRNSIVHVSIDRESAGSLFGRADS